MDIKLVQTAQLREISKLRLQTASLMQALLEARQQLQAAEQRAVKLEGVLQEIAQLEWPRGAENDATAAFWMRDTARAILKL